jgi:hypothetical protein
MAGLREVGGYMAGWIAQRFGRRLTAPDFLNNLVRESLPESDSNASAQSALKATMVSK